MSIAAANPVGARRAASVPAPSDALPVILRCTDDDTTVRAPLERPHAP